MRVEQSRVCGGEYQSSQASSKSRRLLSHGRCRTADQVYPQVTINALFDEVLLDIFEFYLTCPLPPSSHKEDAWHTLVHVCRRWRYVVFGSPRRLDLRLLCTNGRLLNTLDIWPELPIVIHVDGEGIYPLPRVANVVSMLKWRDRVCKIFTNDVPNSFLKEVATLTEPFPALIELDLTTMFERDPPILSDSFLGGSVPRLRSLNLWGIPFPALGKLLLTARDLVTLSLGFIPPSGFISPDAMVDILSTLPKLKTFDLSFDHFDTPQIWDHRASQRSPALTRVVLPALTNFEFYGNSRYLDGIMSQIDAPLDSIAVTFSNELVVSDIPLLRDFISFISRTQIPNGPHRLDTSFSSIDVEISLFQRKGDVDFKVLNLRILCSCYAIDSQLSSLARACSTFLPPLPNLELLGIFNSKHLPSLWQHGVDNTLWMELLRPFTTVKDLVLDELVVLSVASFLQGLAREQVTTILPALQNIFLEGVHWSGPVPEGIVKFIIAREL